MPIPMTSEAYHAMLETMLPAFEAAWSQTKRGAKLLQAMYTNDGTTPAILLKALLAQAEPDGTPSSVRWMVPEASAEQTITYYVDPTGRIGFVCVDGMVTRFLPHGRRLPRPKVPRPTRQAAAQAAIQHQRTMAPRATRHQEPASTPPPRSLRGRRLRPEDTYPERPRSVIERDDPSETAWRRTQWGYVAGTGVLLAHFRQTRHVVAFATP